MKTAECGCLFSGAVQMCSLHAAAPALLEALANVTASLENVMIHFQGRMPHGDVLGRRKVLDEASAILRDVEGESNV